MNAETLHLLEWVAQKPRTYRETIEAWRTQCPRLSVWEDAIADGLIQVVANGGPPQVVATARGRAALAVTSAVSGSGPARERSVVEPFLESRPA